jgi:hypothetical protein
VRAVALALVALAWVACSKGSTASGAASRDAGRRGGGECGALECVQYDTAQEAFAAAVASEPLVLAVGEAHAPKGSTATSAAKRFADDLLPTIAPRASDLLVEMMMPPRGCVDAAGEVRERQTVVTARQAATDQNEYVAMGEKARSLGLVPDMLRPSCDDLEGVRGTGDAIGASLELIARLMREQAARLVERDARSDADAGKMVVTYGGLLHNDLAATGEAAKWSYAPALDEAVAGRLVAVDLVVPEFIGDDASWASLAWRPYYDRARLGKKATLFRTAERSFVLVFPVSPVTGESGAPR